MIPFDDNTNPQQQTRSPLVITWRPLVPLILMLTAHLRHMYLFTEAIWCTWLRCIDRWLLKAMLHVCSYWIS